jgi:hypothetical protein
MQNETLKRINVLLKSFNSTFNIKAEVLQEKDELVADVPKIKSLKNDGSDFINTFHETFNSIVQNISEEHEVIYNEDRGLVIAKKVVKTDYVIEEFQ